MSADKVFIDTNVLVYAFDQSSPPKQRRAQTLIAEHGRAGTIVLSTQVLQEFYVNVTRKLPKPLPESDAEANVRDFTAFDVVQVDSAMVLRAITTSRAERLSLWDALIVAAAQARACRRLLTEDLQHGRQFGSLRVENPFLAEEGEGPDHAL